jgi:hypothetical protein
MKTLLKSKVCKNCKGWFEPNKPLQNVCTLTCAIQLARKKTEEKEAKEWRVRKKEGKAKLKTLGEYEAEAREWFQRFIRLRDKDLACISCEREADSYDGGHYFKAELYSGLIFHEDNCHKQCKRPCNMDLHGNESNYRIGLVKKIGEERVKWLEENKDMLRTYKYSKAELIQIKEIYKGKVKEIKATV